jgi:hypothetical protein
MGKSKKSIASSRARKAKTRAITKSKTVHLTAAPLTIGSPEIGQPGLGQGRARKRR